MTEVFVAEELRKSFGKVEALAGLSLSVTAGEVHGFLGPNGAGKSTTIRVLLGLLQADSGRVELFGRDPWRNAPGLHARLAYVPGDVALWPGLTGGQCLDLLGATHGAVDQQRRADLIARFELDPTKRVRDYFKGNRQKVGLIAALAADAEFYVFDEPTSGLDPLMEHAFQECVRERNEAGATVLLSSHILAEVEALADRVSIVRRGVIVESGTLADLRQHTSTLVQATTSQPPQLGTVADLETTELPDGSTKVRCSVDPDQLEAVIGALHHAGLKALTVEPPSLDALFLDAYTNEAPKHAKPEPAQ